MQAQLDSVRASATPAQQAAATAAAAGDEPLPPHLVNDPAMIRLVRLEKAQADMMKAVTSLAGTLADQQKKADAAAENARVAGIRNTEAPNVAAYVEAHLIERDPEVKGNPLLAAAIRRETKQWLANTFEPSGDLQTQYNEFLRGMVAFVKEMKVAANAGAGTPRQQLEVAAAAANNNPTATGTKPPPVTNAFQAASRMAAPGSPFHVAQMLKEAAAKMGVK